MFQINKVNQLIIDDTAPYAGR